jgi:hypothetical protein
MASEKIDLYKIHKDQYITPKEPVLVKMPRARYLTISGQGEPGGTVFTEKLGALYNVAYTIKMTRKFAGVDYKVCALEGLWWGALPNAYMQDQPRPDWHWKLLIRTPDFIVSRDMQAAIAACLAKGKPTLVGEVKLEWISEGLCMQALHVGPYASEPETVARMMAFAADTGCEPHGLHHEIYLSDPRRVAPERTRTILRIPLRKVKAPARQLEPA